VIGVQTYGKGSMQHVYEFEDGSALKLTVARYYLPGGETITPGVGVTPDLLVPLRPATDQRADLKAEVEGLVMPDEQRRRLMELIESLPENDTEAATSPIWSGSLSERMMSDLQLQAAWQHLRSTR
jgi:C-terminal processing protease CtpA/Prc